MQEALAAKSHKMVTIVDPHIKTDPNYRIFKEAQSKGLFVKDRDGHDYKGCASAGETRSGGGGLGAALVTHVRGGALIPP